MTMRPAFVALLIVLPALVAVPAAGGVVHLEPKYFVHVGEASLFVTVGEYTAAPQSFFCGGRTFDVTLTMVTQRNSAYASIVADGGPDCVEFWGPMELAGSWARGWTGKCFESVPAPCILMDLGAFEPGAELPLSIQGINVGPRTGYVLAPS